MKSPESQFFDENAEHALDRELAGCEFLSPNDKADIMLLSSGVKKAAIISVLGSLKDRNDEARFERDTTRLQRILKNAHLPYDLSSHVDGTFITKSFDVGSNQTTIALLRATKGMKSDERTVAEGQLFDYPETAIRGYVDHKRKDNTTLPEEIRKSDSMAFLNFRLSEDHWADEWKTVEARAEEVKAIAPEVYRTAIEEMRRSRG